MHSSSLTVRSPRRQRRQWNLTLLALPLMALVMLFCYVPLAGWILSLFEYIPGTPIFQNKFVGLKYFQLLFQNSDMLRVMKNTVIFSLISYAALPLPMILAILLNELPGKRFRKFSQTVTTMPHFISWIIVYSLAFSMFSNDGVLNQFLANLGLRQTVLTDSKAVYWFQSALSIWKTVGWNAIIYIAAITGIDPELYEAATVDGAGRFRCALHITIPGMMPTFLVLALLCVSNLVNQGLDQYFVFKNSMVFDNIEVLELFTYRLGLQLYDYSFATTVGIFKSIISILLLFVTNAIAKRVRGTSIV